MLACVHSQVRPVWSISLPACFWRSTQLSCGLSPLLTYLTCPCNAQAASDVHNGPQANVLDVEKLCAADSLFDSEFGRRVKAADRDGDGRLSVGEFRSVVWSEIEGWKRAKQLRAILIGICMFTVLVVGANIAMAITVAGKAARPWTQLSKLQCLALKLKQVLTGQI